MGTTFTKELLLILKIRVFDPLILRVSGVHLVTITTSLHDEDEDGEPGSRVHQMNEPCVMEFDR